MRSAKVVLPEKDRETLLDILEEESSRLNQLVGNLLNYARPLATEPRRVSLVELLERTLGIVPARPGLQTELSDPDSVGPIFGDPSLLRQVFDNLVQNAVQAMGAGGKLEVSLARAVREGVEGVLVTVADTGQGMTPEVTARAKDPFFTTRPSGTGLGLAIVDRIVEAHGGELSIESRKGSGTLVRVFLACGSEISSKPPRLRPLMDSTATPTGD